MKHLLFGILCGLALCGCRSQTSFGDRAADAATLAAGNPVEETIRARRSIRRYEPQPVGRDTLLRILDCGLQAPNGQGRESWEVRVVTDSALLAALDRQYGCYVRQVSPESESAASGRLRRSGPGLHRLRHDLRPLAGGLRTAGRQHDPRGSVRGSGVVLSRRAVPLPERSGRSGVAAPPAIARYAPAVVRHRLRLSGRDARGKTPEPGESPVRRMICFII